MSWLHTWVGLLLGWVLYLMFVTGTAGYLDTEIDRWMKPELPPARPVPAEYNKKLSAILAKRDLAPEDMVKIHELTYTLENALDKIRAETAALAQTLEEVHVASERQDAKTVKARGQSYLRTAREIVR
jgi:hypothetical protein